MTPRALPQWIVAVGGVNAIIRVDESSGAELRTDGPGGPLLSGSPLELCQLGMALVEASRVAGQLATRRKR